MTLLRTLGIGGAALAVLLVGSAAFHARVANASLADDIICATFTGLDQFGSPIPGLSHDDCPSSLPEASSTLIVFKKVDNGAGGRALAPGAPRGAQGVVVVVAGTVTGAKLCSSAGKKSPIIPSARRSTMMTAKARFIPLS